jgi:hypothetical protein
LTDQQVGALEHGYEHGQQARRSCQDEQEREDQRERTDQQEHQEQPRAQHEDDGRSVEGWAPISGARSSNTSAQVGRSGEAKPRRREATGRRVAD